jgi:hypothetical protein
MRCRLSMKAHNAQCCACAEEGATISIEAALCGYSSLWLAGGLDSFASVDMNQHQ